MNIDQDLVSGLLSALHNFSEVELKHQGIESIEMAGLTWTYLDSKDIFLLLIAADDKGHRIKDNEIPIRKIA